MLLFFDIAIAGLFMLVASIIFGELFEFLDIDFGGIGGDGGGGPVTTPIVSMALTAFGATGMLTQYAGWGVLLSVATATAAAVAFGALGGYVATIFYRQTAGTDDAFTSVRGQVGELTTSITDTPGEVVVTSYGSTHTRLARSVSGEHIPRGTLVRIVEVMGNTMVVEPITSDSQHGEESQE
ncbi:MAG: NfeD family protein [Chloroflexota bacterium]